MKTTLLYLVSALCLILLFFGGPGAFAVRSLGHAWNLGHVVAFAAFSMLLRQHWRWLSVKDFRFQTAMLLLFGVVAGGAVEIVQGLTGGDCQWVDLGRDLIGCLVAAAFLTPRHLTPGRNQLRLFQAATAGLVLLAALPTVLALTDEVIAWKQFPVLADFETPLEIDRWAGGARLSIDRQWAASGKAALKIALSTARYSGATLKYFPGDWRGYAALSFAVFNPEAEPLRLVCKITDAQHDGSGHRYADRFNRSLFLDRGWNRFRVPLADVAAAPQGRKMDLGKVTQFSLFAVDLGRPRMVVLDEVRLVQKGNG